MERKGHRFVRKISTIRERHPYGCKLESSGLLLAMVIYIDVVRNDKGTRRVPCTVSTFVRPT